MSRRKNGNGKYVNLILYNINININMSNSPTTINIDPTSLTLAKDLLSYKFLIFAIFTFLVVAIILHIFNPKGFNAAFGYEMFLTAPLLLLLAFLIKEVIIFKNNPSNSIFSNFSQSNEAWFLTGLIIMLVLIGLAGFFSMLAIGGIFSDKPPENNTSMILNFVLITAFLITVIMMYNTSKKKDDVILEAFPQTLQDVFALRTKYTVMFFLFVFAIIVLYFVNPYGIMTNYGGPVLFFSLFIGMIFLILITVYQYYLANPSKVNFLKDESVFASYVIKGLYILGALAISGGLIYAALKMMGVFDQDASNPESLGHIILNLLLFCAMLGIIYKLVNAGGFLDKNPYYRLFLNIILYIPCLLIIALNSVISLFNGSNSVISLFNGSNKSSIHTPPKPFEYKMLVLSLVLLLCYFTWVFLGKPFIRTKYLKQGGQQLVNQPIQTDVLTNIASFQSLSGTETFNYQYAISFWFYIDSFSPSTNSSYLKVVPILSFGENPAIKYSSANNTLYITVKQQSDGTNVIDYVHKKETEIKSDTSEKWKEKITEAIEKVKEIPFGNDIDAEGNRIIYKQPDVLLQKWNHIVLNYNGGTLDVFYNGKLVKSAIEVVPYMKMDMLTVGTENGISGNVANLIYFKNPLDILTINTLYTSLKDKNPPSIPDNKEQLIPLQI